LIFFSIKYPRRKQRGIQQINNLQFSYGKPVASYGELEPIKNLKIDIPPAYTKSTIFLE